MKQKLALLLTALLLLTGCSSGGSGDTADGQDDGELETIDVVLDWYPNAVHAFLYEAEEKGYFAEEGLQVNILFPSNASDPLTMTAAGRADIGFYYQEDTIIAKANEDVPVKVLGAVVQQPISIVCALAEKNIKTPEDLIGKTIGYSGTRFGEVAVGQMLETVGATLDDVELIDVGFDLMSAMTTGNVDATFGCFINHEVPALEEEGLRRGLHGGHGLRRTQLLRADAGDRRGPAGGQPGQVHSVPAGLSEGLCRYAGGPGGGVGAPVGQPGRGELPLDGVRGTAKL